MSSIDFKQVMLHAIGIWALTFVGGFAVGFAFAMSGGAVAMELVGLVNMALIFLAVLIFCYFRKVTWTHFVLVFLALTAISLFNIFMGPISVTQVLFGCAVVTVVGAFGKLIGDFLGRNRRTEAHETFD